MFSTQESVPLNISLVNLFLRVLLERMESRQVWSLYRLNSEILRDSDVYAANIGSSSRKDFEVAAIN